MPKRTIHNATVTLKLPFNIGVGAELTALREAGIPVDALGNAQHGFLFVRPSNGKQSQTNIFRWFAGEVGQAPG